MGIQYRIGYNKEQDSFSVFEIGRVDQWGEPYCIVPLVSYEKAKFFCDGLNSGDPAYADTLLEQANRDPYVSEEDFAEATKEIVDKIRKFAYALRNVGLESEGEPMQTSEIVAQFAEFADGTCKRERLAIAEYLLELTNIQDNS